MDFLDEIINATYEFLIGTNGGNTNIIRKHTKHLEKQGDLSFPRHPNCWRTLIDPHNRHVIFEYLNRTEDDLLQHSKKFHLKFVRWKLIKDDVHWYFDRKAAYEKTIGYVLINHRYGAFKLPKKKYNLEIDIENNDVTGLRIKMIKSTTENIIKFCGGVVVNEKSFDDDQVNLIFSPKSTIDSVCLCGVVLNKDGVRDWKTTEDEFINNHIIQTRLIAEHKYGIRIISKDGWKEFFEKLGIASATLELLQNKIGSAIRSELSNPTYCNNKGLSFILYNCARLSKLYKDYKVRVEMNIYPKLPPIEEVDFSHLKEPEEWELYYVYVLQFPNCIKNCIRDIEHRKVNLHHLVQFLSGLSNIFSVYYRRVKIITEPRDHLYPILFAKIYFLKTLQRVMHTSLGLMGIEPIKQM